MRRILLFSLFFIFGIVTTTAYADGEIVDISSNPDEMIILESAPKAFMYNLPYYGYLDSKDFTVKGLKATNVDAAHDNDPSTVARINEEGYLLYEFSEEKNVESFYVRVKSTNAFKVQFLNSTGVLIKEFNTTAPMAGLVELVQNVDVRNVKKIKLITNGGFWYSDIYEFDINLAEVFLPVFNLSSNSGERSVNITWELPNSKKLVDVKVNDKSIGKVNSYNSSGLEPNTEYEYNIATVYEDGTEINTTYKTRTLIDVTPPGKITNLKLKQKGEDVEISYELPTDIDFEYVVIKRDGQVIARDYKDTIYTDKKLSFGKEYKYEVIAFDKSRNASDPAIGKKTLVTQEVINLRAKAEKYNEVELNWILPNAEGFEKVVIYRKDNDVGLLSRLFSNNETALFETNGTQFKDLTVKADTSYTYRVTSFVNQNETEGQTVTIRTPRVSAIGGGSEQDENGDYIITWDNPVTGQMKVLVGGKQFAIVPASDKQIVIPKDQMKFDLLGNQDVQLIPIDEEGNPGIPSKPGGSGNGGNGGNGGIGEIGGSVSDILEPDEVLNSAVSLLGIISAFLLLGLAFRVVPKIIQTIRTALGARNEKDNVLPGTGRRTQ